MFTGTYSVAKPTTLVCQLPSQEKCLENKASLDRKVLIRDLLNRTVIIRDFHSDSSHQHQAPSIVKLEDLDGSSTDSEADTSSTSRDRTSPTLEECKIDVDLEDDAIPSAGAQKADVSRASSGYESGHHTKPKDAPQQQQKKKKRKASKRKQLFIANLLANHLEKLGDAEQAQVREKNANPAAEESEEEIATGEHNFQKISFLFVCLCFFFLLFLFHGKGKTLQLTPGHLQTVWKKIGHFNFLLRRMFVISLISSETFFFILCTGFKELMHDSPSTFRKKISITGVKFDPYSGKKSKKPELVAHNKAPPESPAKDKAQPTPEVQKESSAPTKEHKPIKTGKKIHLTNKGA